MLVMLQALDLRSCPDPDDPDGSDSLGHFYEQQAKLASEQMYRLKGKHPATMQAEAQYQMLMAQELDELDLDLM